MCVYAILSIFPFDLIGDRNAERFDDGSTPTYLLNRKNEKKQANLMGN